MFATALATRAGSDKAFVGREALERRRAEAHERGGPVERVVSLVVGDADVVLWGGEALVRDGVAVGQVTSAARGATVGAAVGLAVVRRADGVTQDWLASGDVQVDVAGERHDVRLSFAAPLA